MLRRMSFSWLIQWTLELVLATNLRSGFNGLQLKEHCQIYFLFACLRRIHLQMSFYASIVVINAIALFEPFLLLTCCILSTEKFTFLEPSVAQNGSERELELVLGTAFDMWCLGNWIRFDDVCTEPCAFVFFFRHYDPWTSSTLLYVNLTFKRSLVCCHFSPSHVMHRTNRKNTHARNAMKEATEKHFFYIFN